MSTSTLLFKSTIIMTTGHLAALYIYNPYSHLMIYTHLFGGITSILNHGLKHDLFKYLDRTTMIFAFCIDLFLIGKIYKKSKNKFNMHNIMALLIFATLLYFSAKTIQKKYPNDIIKRVPHAIAHIIITIAHILLIREYWLVRKKN